MNYAPYQPNFGGFRQDYMPLQQTVRPVTSREEAAVAQIPFDGTAAYFINTASGEIYSRAFRADGTAPLITYRRVEDSPVVQYATVEQLQAVMDEIEKLRKPVGKAAKKDDE